MRERWQTLSAGFPIWQLVYQSRLFSRTGALLALLTIVLLPICSYVPSCSGYYANPENREQFTVVQLLYGYFIASVAIISGSGLSGGSSPARLVEWLSFLIIPTGCVVFILCALLVLLSKDTALITLAGGGGLVSLVIVLAWWVASDPKRYFIEPGAYVLGGCFALILAQGLLAVLLDARRSGSPHWDPG